MNFEEKEGRNRIRGLCKTPDFSKPSITKTDLHKGLSGYLDPGQATSISPRESFGQEDVSEIYPEKLVQYLWENLRKQLFA